MKIGIHMAGTDWPNPAEGAADQGWDWLWEIVVGKFVMKAI